MLTNGYPRHAQIFYRRRWRFCAAFFFCFRSFFPIAYTFLFVAVPILLALTSLTLGVAEILQQRRGVLMHVESEGIALYPFSFSLLRFVDQLRVLDDLRSHHTPLVPYSA